MTNLETIDTLNNAKLDLDGLSRIVFDMIESPSEVSPNALRVVYTNLVSVCNSVSNAAEAVEKL